MRNLLEDFKSVDRKYQMPLSREEIETIDRETEEFWSKRRAESDEKGLPKGRNTRKKIPFERDLSNPIYGVNKKRDQNNSPA